MTYVWVLILSFGIYQGQATVGTYSDEPNCLDAAKDFKEKYGSWTGPTPDCFRVKVEKR